MSRPVLSTEKLRNRVKTLRARARLWAVRAEEEGHRLRWIHACLAKADAANDEADAIESRLRGEHWVDGQRVDANGAPVEPAI